MNTETNFNQLSSDEILLIKEALANRVVFPTVGEFNVEIFETGNILSTAACYGYERNTEFECWKLSSQAKKNEESIVVDDSVTLKTIFGAPGHKRVRPKIFAIQNPMIFL